MATKSSPPPPIARRFIWYVSSFMVCVVVGLAPFLGLVRVPGFRALLDLFPLQLQDDLIPISAFLMGLIAVGVQFYSTEKIHGASLSQWFRVGFACMLFLLLSLLVLYKVFVVRILVPDADRTIAVLVGWSQEDDCCKGVRSIKECVQSLSFNEAAIESCWGSRDLTVAGLLLSFPYLALTGGIGALIGIIIVKESVQWQDRQNKKQEIEAAPTTENRLPGTLAPPPPAATAAEHVVRPKPDRKGGTVVFDVFLCHNSADKPSVKEIGKQLEERGVLPWLDEWELPPGQPWQSLLEQQIDNIKSAAVFVGSEGFGPWQKQELLGFLSEFVDRQCPVIPVLLPNAPSKPDLPIFLKAMTWVDFRTQDPDPLDRLIWGITGKRPKR